MYRLALLTAVLVLAGLQPAVAAAYDWPLKPFGAQHAIRGAFDDPRFAGDGDGGRTSAFHFGIDVVADDGEAVYAIDPGFVTLRRTAVVVTARGGHRFGYWHIAPALSSGEHVARHQLVGYVLPGRGHLHLAESIGGAYVNPLRRGGIAPFLDHTRPCIADVLLLEDGRPADITRISGPFDVVVEAYDPPPIVPPSPWSGAVLTPALIRWRLLGEDGLVVPWQSGLDFRRQLHPPSLFDLVYAPETRQNRPFVTGFYRFNLIRDVDPQRLGPGVYDLQVEAFDTRSNVGRRSLPFRIP